jgi:hypothetical protein
MKILKAQIVKSSVHYSKGLNPKGKPIWLSITGFNPSGVHNYKIKAIKGIRNGFAEYVEIWLRPDEIKLKQFEDGQLALDIFSPQELEENKHNPRYYNQRRFEVITANEKFYIYSPDLKTAENNLIRDGICEFSIKQVKRLTKEELSD